MNSLYVEKSYENGDTETIYGDTGVYETCHSDIGALYRSSQQAYGRCAGYVYADRPGGAD